MATTIKLLQSGADFFIWNFFPPHCQKKWNRWNIKLKWNEKIYSKIEKKEVFLKNFFHIEIFFFLKWYVLAELD